MKELNELWKDIPGYEGLYQASSLGRVKSLDRLAVYRKDPKRFYHKQEKLLKQQKSKGYLSVKLFNGFSDGKTIHVHRLVATAFIPNPHKLSTVNHINGNKSDNYVSNLEWVTHSYNVKHSYDTGLKSPDNYKGEGNGTSKLTNLQVCSIRSDHANKSNYTTLSKKYNTSVSNIHSIVKRKSWSHI